MVECRFFIAVRSDRAPFKSGHAAHRLHAFRLIELLVVLAVVGLLAGLLLPALGKAKSKARSVHCLSNLKQLQLAWQLYAHDHLDQLVANRIVGGASTRPALIAPE